ncbi:ABC transporter ATP-binding protein [Candidatus Megaera polyxenophila]|nr:ABC transporter ATP-binding protein [Candidatus Megaera polyxenophila]
MFLRSIKKTLLTTMIWQSYKSFVPGSGFRSYSSKVNFGSPLITVKELDLDYSDKIIFHNLNFDLFPRNKVTIVGENGIGKSTFLRILHQESQKSFSKDLVDWSGSVKVLGTVGYLPQAFNKFDDDFAIEHIVKWSGDDTLGEFINNNPIKPSNFKNWFEEFNALGGYGLCKTLSELKLEEEILCRQMHTLSGGQKTKVHLAALAFQEPEILLLDEPTNHLDMAGLKWLSNYIKRFNGGVVMVTHDRALISETSDRISELSPISHNFVHFTGGYKKYLEAQKLLAEKAKAKAERYKKEKKALEEELHNALAVKETKIYKPPKDNDKIGFNAKGQRKQKQEGNKIINLKSKIDEIDKELQTLPQTRKELDIQITYKDSGFFQISVTNFSCEIDGKLLFNPVSFSASPGQKIIITGPNGVGKTSLLRSIEHPENFTSINLSGKVKVGYLNQEQEDIDTTITAVQYIKETSGDKLNQGQVLELLYRFGISSHNDLYRPIENLSTGTIRKLQLAGIIASGANLLLLDEPTNHIDIMSMEAIEEQLHDFPGIVIATSHDRYFMDALGNASILNLEEYYEV